MRLQSARRWHAVERPDYHAHRSVPVPRARVSCHVIRQIRDDMKVDAQVAVMLMVFYRTKMLNLVTLNAQHDSVKQFFYFFYQYA